MARQPDFGPAVPDPADSRRHRPQGERRCLSCGGQFASTGPGNRICRKCKHLNAWKSGVRDFAAPGAFRREDMP
jgi:hypothetical protein